MDQETDSKPQVPDSQNELPFYKEGSLLEAAVTEATRELAVSRSMAMMCALGAIAVACQQGINVEMPTGHVVPTSLMLLTIAESGERKTTTQNYFFAAIKQANFAANEKYQQDMLDFKVQYEVWATKKHELSKTYKKRLSSGDIESIDIAQSSLETHLSNEPKAPTSGRLLYEDATPPALVQMLHNNNHSGVLLASEASSIFSGKALSELDKLNTLWDGGEVIVDRISREGFILNDARLTLSLMAQPSVIQSFMKRRGSEARGTGFLARFLIFKPQTMAGNRPQPRRMNLSRKDDFNKRIKDILASHRGKDRQILHLSETATDLWHKYHATLEDEMKKDNLFYHLRDHASKLLENTIRLAANVHKFEQENENDLEIKSETLEFCWTVTRSCSNHFISEIAGEPQVVADANLLARFLTDKARQGAHPQWNQHSLETVYYQTTLSEITRLGPNSLRERDQRTRLNAAIELIEKLGHIYKDRHTIHFQDTIASCYAPGGPKQKNGEFVTVKELPLFTEQEMRRIPGKEYYFAHKA